ncbi:MAG: fructose-bisphosphate aldolase class I [Chloroflexi bacterium]|nr:MAG: fructose-bisphosphate aldolase class I [Chloroflexota bacterium]
MADLAAVAKTLVAPGKGILAADESTSTIKRRFDAIGVENNEENRRSYRELLFRTPGMGKYISGVILYDETIRQKASDGTPLVKVLTDQGVIPGIKVDIGAKPLAKSPKETVTEGLDGLRERLAEYKKLGAQFSKWRAVINIEGEDIPSLYSIRVNSHALARYAALSQEAGIVPIVEPEVLMDGDHSIDRCYEVSVRALRTVFNQLASQRVDFDGMLLKPAMVLSGKEARDRAPAETVATVNLDAINRRAAEIGGVPWQLSFSYGRGLQAAPQKAWSGKKENIVAAQRAFAHRSRVTSAARNGEYDAEMEKEPAPV